jgi:predicted amidophosphoribosyltransferase
MPQPPLLKIDESNRSAHYYIEEGHECFFFHEYTARKGYAHSDGNGLVINLKKSVLLKGQPQYKYKGQAINTSASMLRAAFEKAAWVFKDATIAPIPPSKLPAHPEYDDRMMQVVRKACDGKGADVRELLRQAQSYEASHTQVDGQRKKPHELEAMYTVEGLPPKGTVVLVDDVLTTGAHFVAVRNVIRATYPDRRVLGMFIARRVPSNPFEDFEAL